MHLYLFFSKRFGYQSRALNSFRLNSEKNIIFKHICIIVYLHYACLPESSTLPGQFVTSNVVSRDYIIFRKIILRMILHYTYLYIIRTLYTR